MQTLPAFVASRRLGQATVTIISEGSLLWAPTFQVADAEWRRALPEATARGEVWLGINVAHVQINAASILIDPGFDDPSAPCAGPPAWPALTRSPGLAAGLASIGVRPEQITHVLITHTHDDHFAGETAERDGERVARFPRASPRGPARLGRQSKPHAAGLSADDPPGDTGAAGPARGARPGV